MTGHRLWESGLGCSVRTSGHLPPSLKDQFCSDVAMDGGRGVTDG